MHTSETLIYPKIPTPIPTGSLMKPQAFFQKIGEIFRYFLDQPIKVPVGQGSVPRRITGY